MPLKDVLSLGLISDSLASVGITPDEKPPLELGIVVGGSADCDRRPELLRISFSSLKLLFVLNEIFSFEHFRSQLVLGSTLEQAFYLFVNFMLKLTPNLTA